MTTQKRPTPERLVEIRKWRFSEPGRADLLGAKDELIAEIDALRVERDSVTIKWSSVCDDNLKMYEITRERDRYREALEQAKKNLIDGSNNGVFWREVGVDKIDSALNHKYAAPRPKAGE